MNGETTNHNGWIPDQAEKELFAKVVKQAQPEYWQERCLKAEADCNELRAEIAKLKDEKYTILHKGED